MVVHTTILSFGLVLRREEMGSRERDPWLSPFFCLTLPSRSTLLVLSRKKNHYLPGYLLNRLAGNVNLRPAMLDTFLLRVTKLLLDVRQ
jgi:hypothetical protein